MPSVSDTSERASYIQEILKYSEVKNFKSGAFVFQEGQEDSYFYLVMKGEVEISKKTSDGSPRVIAHLRPGEILGEGVLSGVLIKPASARALGDVELMALSKGSFETILKEDTPSGIEFLLSVVTTLNGRLNGANIKFLALYEINALIGSYQDDLKGLSQALIHKLLDITDSKDGILLIKNPFDNTHRVIYSSDSVFGLNEVAGFNKQESKIVLQEDYQYILVDLMQAGFLAIRKSAHERHYDDDLLRLLILVAEQVGNAIQAASRRANDRAKDILHQKKFVL